MLAHFAELACAISEQAGARLPGSRRVAQRAAAAADGIEVSEEALAGNQGDLTRTAAISAG